MNSAPMSNEIPYPRTGRRSWPTTCARILWDIVRLPVLTVLLVLEPLVSLILTAVAVFGLTAAVILGLSGNLPRFPFWGMVTFSAASLLPLTAYRTLMGIFSK